MKAIWSGSISFGLVNIPIMLHSAITEHRFGFRMLCSKCHTPLTYIRWCPHCRKEVIWEKIVKGFKKNNGDFATLTQEDIEELKPKGASLITIKEFVDQSEISTLYIKDHYYISPGKGQSKAFFLFLEALKKSHKVAIGQFVMHEKEYLIAINTHENMLLLTTLHYQHEIRNVESLYTTKAKPSREDLTLALQLINKLTRKKFDVTKYKDTFIESLKKAIKTAKKGKKIKATQKKTHKKESLRASLQASLQEEARA